MKIRQTHKRTLKLKSCSADWRRTLSSSKSCRDISFSSTPVQQHFLHTTPSHGSDQSGCVTPGGGSKSMAAQIENGGVAGYQYWRLLPEKSG
ncbi:uncharacterized protein LOC135333586 isoform X2 [Halichondria panicea]|uniref:uncharacterized protein LOC135333586 isoform X2 n=1 Tax=Halichondria panicea TaxID=6063 RepID=UPI00312B6784